MWQRLGRTGDTCPGITAVFLSSYKLPERWPVTTLLLFGHVMLLCGTFLFILLSELLWTPSDRRPRSTPPAYPFPQVRLASGISARAKFHHLLHMRLSHRGGCGELAQDPGTQRTVWIGLLTHTHTHLQAHNKVQALTVDIAYFVFLLCYRNSFNC